MAAKMDCPVCKGSGLVPHKKRQIGPEDARVDDPTDFQTEEVCSAKGCNGGKVPYVDDKKS
jgi:hypothetical protein